MPRTPKNGELSAFYFLQKRRQELFKAGYLRIKDKKCCHGCCYYSTWTNTCDFYLIEGRRRPCPGGKQCTIKAEESRRQIRNEELNAVLTITPDDAELMKRIETEGKITNERNHE